MKEKELFWIEGIGQPRETWRRMIENTMADLDIEKPPDLI